MRKLEKRGRDERSHEAEGQGKGMNHATLPESWGSWSINKILGEGAYGTVYLAQKTIETDVSESAIKIIQIPKDKNEILALSFELGNQESVVKYYEDLVKAYIQEIKTMIALKGNPNVVYIEDYAVEKNAEALQWIMFIRMEYLSSFAEYSQTHSFSEADVVRLGIDICNALSACEKKGIIHRDIKPSNIFISPETNLFKLGDFGVARKLDRSSGVYSAKGTFPYMAPEVFHSKPYDQRSDLYSLGLVLYHLLNRNREPFVDLNKQIVYIKDRENATSRRMSGEQLPPPIDASPQIADVILKACHPDPEKRYPNADAFRKALENIKKEETTLGKKDKKRLMWCLPIIIALAILTIMLFSRYASENKPDEVSVETNLSNPIEETAVVPTEIDIRYTGIVPIMEEKHLYFNPQTGSCVRIPINSVLAKMEEAGCSLSGEDLELFSSELKSQFYPEGNEKISSGEDFSEGDRIQLVYRPNDAFNDLLESAGIQLKYDVQTFVVKSGEADNRLRFVREDL